jgi:two-component system LytT family response regulator
VAAKAEGRDVLSAVLRDVSAHGRTLDRFVVERRGRLQILRASEVRWLESVGNHVRVHVKDGTTHVIRTTLQALAEQLNPQQFVRIHRAAIVQIACVTALSPRGHGDATVTLDDGTQLSASRSRIGALRTALPGAG